MERGVLCTWNGDRKLACILHLFLKEPGELDLTILIALCPEEHRWDKPLPSCQLHRTVIWGRAVTFVSNQELLRK